MTGQTTWRELHSQPDAWEDLIARVDVGRDLPALDLAGFDEIVMLGSGTSYYLALAAADWVRERWTGSVRALPSCELLLDTREATAAGRRRLAVAVSRSGESSELILAVDALKAQGATVLGVSCVAGSSLLRRADVALPAPEGREDGFAMLRSFTCMLIALQYLFGSEADRAALRALPNAGRRVLDDRHAALRAFSRSRPFDRLVFLASGRSHPLALEGALKAQEMAGVTTEAYHSLEYRHGPKVSADRNTLIALCALTDPGLGLSLARDVKALGAALLVVGPGAEVYRGVADLVIPAGEELGEGPAAAATMLPLQILAFETAMRRGVDPDAPVNLNRVVLFEAAVG